MIVAFDIGNTRVKWARVEQGRLLDPGQIEHLGHPCSAVRDVLGGLAGQPERIIVADVTGPATRKGLAQLAESLGGGQRLELAETLAAHGPVRNGYEDYRQLGVDRWLAICAAYHRKQQATCLADAGTALTVDLVAADGAHLGGYILPGQRLMYDALRWRTGRLAAPPGRPGMEPCRPGRDTETAVAAGALLAMAGLVDRAAETLRAHAGAVEVIVTGGDAEALAGELALPAEICPHLVLEGLVLQAGA